MIVGGWPFVWTAYALTVSALTLLAAIVLLRLRHWSQRARELDRT